MSTVMFGKFVIKTMYKISTHISLDLHESTPCTATLLQAYLNSLKPYGRFCDKVTSFKEEKCGLTKHEDRI